MAPQTNAAATTIRNTSTTEEISVGDQKKKHRTTFFYLTSQIHELKILISVQRKIYSHCRSHRSSQRAPLFLISRRPVNKSRADSQAQAAFQCNNHRRAHAPNDVHVYTASRPQNLLQILNHQSTATRSSAAPA